MTLDDLIKKIIDNGFINCKKYLQEYDQNKNDYDDYKKYIFQDKLKYHRERIYIDDNIEIFVITWLKNQYAKIHNHSKNGCFLKILEGNLEEIIYSNDLKIIKENKLKPGDISYMNDTMGLHSVTNTNDEICVSIHVYSPPNHKTHFFFKKNI